MPPAIGKASDYRRRLRGWLSYAFASEVFAVVSLATFLPLCLEQFARDNGYVFPGKTEPCSGAVPLNSTTPTDIAHVNGDERCIVKVGWGWIDTASFSLYIYSISVFLQAITVISTGGIADTPSHRKPLLFVFAFLGSISATLFLIIPLQVLPSPLWWLLTALLAINANVGFGASIVALNSYLPGLAKDSPEVTKILEEVQAQEPTDSVRPPSQDEDEVDDLAPLIASQSADTSPSSELHAKYEQTLSSATSRISALGIALGYGAGIFLLILTILPVTLLKGSTFSLRLAIGLSGIWWLCFSFPAMFWLPSGRVETVAPEWAVGHAAIMDDDGRWHVKKQVAAAWRRLGGMLRWREVLKLKNTFKFLAAWFLLSDGFTTISSTAVLFGKTSLHMPASSLIIVGALAPTCGIFGSLLWPVLQRRYAWSNLRALITLVLIGSLIPAYGCLGFLPLFRNEENKPVFGGLTTPGEMYALAIVFGSAYGAFQSYARALYAEILPPGEEARWYALYSITDKSSSFIGPLFVGLIADGTGNIRYAFFFLAGMMWLAVPLLLSVNVEKGREDARKYRYEI